MHIPLCWHWQSLSTRCKASVGIELCWTLVKMCLVAPGVAYVALSRVILLEGVCIIGLNTTAFHKNDIAGHAEYRAWPIPV